MRLAWVRARVFVSRKVQSKEIFAITEEGEMGMVQSMATIIHNDRVPELLAVIRRGPFAEPNETGDGQHVAPATAHVAPGGWHASASAPMAARPIYNYCLGGATLYQSPGRSKSSTYSLGYVPSAIRWTSRTTRSSMYSPTSAASKPPKSNSCGGTRRRRLGSFKVIVFVDSGCVRSVPSFPGYPKRWPDWWDRTEAQMRAALHDC